MLPCHQLCSRTLRLLKWAFVALFVLSSALIRSFMPANFSSTFRDAPFPEIGVVLNISTPNGLEMQFLQTPKVDDCLHEAAFLDERFDHDRPFMVIVVKSTSGEFERRAAIRETWGAVAKRFDIPVVFALGNDGNATTNGKVAVENLRNGDILQADFYDRYHNLSSKTLSILLWEANQCPRAYYFFQTDDDCIVFVENLLFYMQTRFPDRLRHANVMHGHCWMGGSPVVRNASNFKNYIPFEIYPKLWYPTYCSGTGFLISGDIPRRLLDEIPSMDMIRKFGNLEDALYTGILAERAKVRRIHTNSILYYNITRITNFACARNVISTHEYKPAAALKENFFKLKRFFVDSCGKQLKMKPKRGRA